MRGRQPSAVAGYACPELAPSLPCGQLPWRVLIAETTIGPWWNDLKCSGLWPHDQARSSPCSAIPRGHVAIESSGMLMEAAGTSALPATLGILARTVARPGPRSQPDERPRCDIPVTGSVRANVTLLRH